MSGAAAFLQKLKSKNTSGVQEMLVDDAEGYRVAIVERGFLQEPIDRLGIRLSEDAQVLYVEPEGPCKKIPVQYFVVSVNDQFVSSNRTFAEEAQKELRLAVKLYNGSAMEELLARIVSASDEEETFDAKKLFESTPRYAFLDGSHPMFMRWDVRHTEALESKKALRAFEELVQEQAAQESMRALQQTVEQAEAEELRDAEAERQRKQRQEEEEERRRQQNESRLEDVIIREKLFTNISAQQGPSLFDEEPASPDHAHQSATEIPSVDPASPNSDEASAQISTEELLRIVSGGDAGPHSASDPSQAPDVDELRTILGVFGTSGVESSLDGLPKEEDEDPEEVTILQRCKREYTLSDGSKVEAVIKERRGAKPKPPSEAPPRRSAAASALRSDTAAKQRSGAAGALSCKYCKSTEHQIGTCHIKRAESKRFLEEETERLKRLRERQICRDFQRGHCSRAPCPFLHDDQRGVRKRSRSISERRRRDDTPPGTHNRRRSTSTRHEDRQRVNSRDDRRRTHSRDRIRDDRRDVGERRRDDRRYDDQRDAPRRHRDVEYRRDDRQWDDRRRDDRRYDERRDDRRYDERRDDRRYDERRDDRNRDERTRRRTPEKSEWSKGGGRRL